MKTRRPIRIDSYSAGERIIERSKGAFGPTAKGRTYIRQCSKRVRAAASKISNDVLDQIVEAIR